jgi:hypothetical protein
MNHLEFVTNVVAAELYLSCITEGKMMRIFRRAQKMKEVPIHTSEGLVMLAARETFMPQDHCYPMEMLEKAEAIVRRLLTKEELQKFNRMEKYEFCK